jgi:hypothetical protein
MTRFDRKNKVIVGKESNIFDLMDNMMKGLWRIDDDELDYICQHLSDDELDKIVPEFKTISEIKEAITIVNKILEKKYEN